MADGTQLNVPESSGNVIATDQITDGGVANNQHAQRVKVGFGADGEYTDAAQGVGFPVQLQDLHTRAIGLRFTKAIGSPTTITVDAVVGAYTLTLASAAGFADGVTVSIGDGSGSFMVSVQIGAAVGNVITLDSPIDVAYASGTAITASSDNLAVDGSVTPQVFGVGPVGSANEVDITRVLGYMQQLTAGDDSNFGDLTALTNGCVFRCLGSANLNLFNVKTNADIKLEGYDFIYSDRAGGAGAYSSHFRITYAGQNKRGVALRLRQGDRLEIIVQDDLSGLTHFHAMAHGHVVGD